MGKAVERRQEYGVKVLPKLFFRERAPCSKYYMSENIQWTLCCKNMCIVIYLYVYVYAYKYIQMCTFLFWSTYWAKLKYLCPVPQNWMKWSECLWTVARFLNHRHNEDLEWEKKYRLQYHVTWESTVSILSLHNTDLTLCRKLETRFSTLQVLQWHISHKLQVTAWCQENHSLFSHPKSLGREPFKNGIHNGKQMQFW